MLSNGDRKSTRPRIEMLGAVEPREAAAVIAAVEQFLADTAQPAMPAPPPNPWQRAALVGGVMTKWAFGPASTDGVGAWL